jgi:hypothetical protein
MIQDQTSFSKWLDTQLNEEIAPNIVAFCLNISESPFTIEIIGSAHFDKDDEDWACNEDWIPEKRNIAVSSELFGKSWEEAQTNMIAMCTQYLKSNMKNNEYLLKAKAFAVGFVDGNLNYVRYN